MQTNYATNAAKTAAIFARYQDQLDIEELDAAEDPAFRALAARLKRARMAADNGAPRLSARLVASAVADAARMVRL